MITDEQLVAYLDEALPADARASIEAALAQDPALSARLSALDLDKTALIAGFETVLAQAPSAHLPTPRMLWAWPAIAAAAAVLLAIGSVFFAQKPAADWRVEVAHYQALYVPETLTGITPDQARLSRELAQAGALLGLTFDQSALSNIPGLTLRRAQVLGFEGQPLIQIAFTGAGDVPVAFCITKNSSGTTSEMDSAPLIGLAAASWQTPDHGFLAIGGKDQSRINTIAGQLIAALQG